MLKLEQVESPKLGLSQNRTMFLEINCVGNPKQQDKEQEITMSIKTRSKQQQQHQHQEQAARKNKKPTSARRRWETTRKGTRSNHDPGTNQ